MPQSYGNVYIGQVKSGSEADKELQQNELDAQGIQLNRLRLTDAVEKRNQEIADRRRAEEGERLWTSTVQKHIDPDTGKPDYDSAIDELYQSAPDIAELKKQQLVKDRTAAIDLRRKELDADKLETANDVETIKRMTTPEAFLSLRPKLSQNGQHIVGDAYNPEHLSQLIAAGEKDVSNTEQMRALLDKDLRGFMLHSLLQANDPAQVQDISEGLDALYGPKQAKMFRAAIGDPLTPEGKQRIQALIGEADSAKGGTSDYAQFLSRWAAEKHQTTPDKLTASQELAARKAYGQADDAARRPLAPIVIQTPQGTMVTTGPDRQSVAPVMGPDGKTLQPMPTSTQRDRQAGMQTAAAIMDSIDELSAKINTGQGALATVKGAAEIAKAKANLSDDVSEYQALTSGFTPLLARAVGHTGVLTEQDVQSVKAMLPQPGDSKAVRDRKMARIRKIMGAMPGASQTDMGGQKASGSVRVKGADGKTYEFPNQAAADAFKKAGG